MRDRLYEGLLDRDLVDAYIVGLAREELIDYLMEFVHKPGDFSPGLDDIGDGSYFDEIADDEDALLRRRRSVTAVIDDLSGEKLSGDRLRTLLIRVCGQFEEIRSGTMSVGRWNSEVPSRSLLRITEMRRVSSKRGRVYEVDMEAYTGIASGSKWSSIITGGRLQQIIREVGAHKYKKYSDFDICNMWLIATVSTDRGRLVLEDVDVGSSQKKYNQKLAQGRIGTCRTRISPKFGKECAPCPIGRDRCALSRFTDTYSEIRMCAYQHRGYFVPGSSESVCLACQIKGR